jgi:hypothetical protein
LADFRGVNFIYEISGLAEKPLYSYFARERTAEIFRQSFLWS